MKPMTLWFYHPTVLPEGKPAVPDFVPPLQRRRFSPLQSRFFTVAHAVNEGLPSRYKTVFASEDGEDALTRRIVKEFNECGEVSPARFSTSVYNAAPGIYSIFDHCHEAYTAIAAGPETPEVGWLEALTERGARLWVYAEETNGGCGMGVRIEAAPLKDTDSWKVVVSDGVPGAPSLTRADMAAFLRGETATLVSRSFTLTRR